MRFPEERGLVGTFGNSCVSFEPGTGARCTLEKATASVFCELHLPLTRELYHQYKDDGARFETRHQQELSPNPRVRLAQLQKLAKLADQVASRRGQFLRTWVHPSCQDSGHLGAVALFEKRHAALGELICQVEQQVRQSTLLKAEEMKERARIQQENEKQQEAVRIQHAREVELAEISQACCQKQRRAHSPALAARKHREEQARAKRSRIMSQAKEQATLSEYQTKSSEEFECYYHFIKDRVVRNCDPEFRPLFEQIRHRLKHLFEAFLPFLGSPSVEHDILVFLRAVLYRKLPKESLVHWNVEFITTAKICSWRHRGAGLSVPSWPIIESVFIDGILRLQHTKWVEDLRSTSLHSSYTTYVAIRGNLPAATAYKALSLAERLGSFVELENGLPEAVDQLVHVLNHRLAIAASNPSLAKTEVC